MQWPFVKRSTHDRRLDEFRGELAKVNGNLNEATRLREKAEQRSRWAIDQLSKGFDFRVPLFPLHLRYSLICDDGGPPMMSANTFRLHLDAVAYNFVIDRYHVPLEQEPVFREMVASKFSKFYAEHIRARVLEVLNTNPEKFK